MANNIELAQHYAQLLDEAYAADAKSAVLNAAPGEVRAGDSAGTFLLAEMTLVGLGDYSRATGFAAGDVVLEWTPYTYTQDRGRTFSVDKMDDLESAGMAFGKLAGEFLRRYVVPEIDAYRFSTIATDAGTDVAADLANAAAWVSALNTAKVALQNAEVDETQMVLFITPTGANLVRNAPRDEATTDLFETAQVVVVPQSRLVTAIDTDPGATSSAGGWAKADGAEDINFILMDKGAVFADTKHAAPRIFDPATNQLADAWKFDYRVYHDCFVREAKAAGIYVHTKAAVS